MPGWLKTLLVAILLFVSIVWLLVTIPMVLVVSFTDFHHDYPPPYPSRAGEIAFALALATPGIAGMWFYIWHARRTAWRRRATQRGSNPERQQVFPPHRNLKPPLRPVARRKPSPETALERRR